MAETADSVIVELIAKTDGYEARVNGAAAATESGMSRIEKSAARAEGQVVRSAGQMANAQRNLGRQVADVGAQLSGGQSPFLIFAQQAPQIADALADTGGKAAKLASFFAGPWGAALLAAGSVVGVLAGKLLETGQGVDTLLAKLQEQARKTEQASQAQTIFDQTTQGLTIALREQAKALDQANASAQRGIFLTLAKAEADRTAAIEARKRAAAELGVAVSAAEGAKVTARVNAGQGTGGLAGSVSNIALARADAEVVRLRQQEAQALKNVATAENQVVRARAPLIRNQVAESLDAATAATGKYERALDSLYAKLKRGNITEAQYRAGVEAATKRRDSDTLLASASKSDQKAIATATKTLADLRRLEAGATGAEKDRLSARVTKAEKRLDLLKSGISSEAVNAATAGGRKGPSEETLRNRAERARIREVRNDEAYNNELEQLNQQIIGSQRERAVTAEQAAQFEREAVDSEYRKRREGIAADLSAKKYTQAQADTLNQLNDYNRALKLRNIAISEDVRLIQENASRTLLALDIQQQQLQADGQIAESRKERQRIELELIALKYRERTIQLEALRQAAQTRGDQNAVNDATAQINALPGLRRAEETGVSQRYRGRYEQYRRDLSSADSLADSIDAIKIDALERVTDELTKATTAALGLKGAFGQVIGEIIRLGIQRKLIGPIADALFGRADGSTAGSIGKLLGSLFGRASGGYVGPNSTVRVNEGRGSGIELLRMGPQGGTVIPLGQTATRPGAAAQQPVVIQLSADEGSAFVPRVTQISGGTAVRVVQAAGPAIAKASAAKTQLDMTRARSLSD